MADSARTRRRRSSVKPVKQPMNEASVSPYRKGDVVHIGLPVETVNPFPPLLLEVDRFDQRHRIVFGTIASSRPGLGKALSPGAKLAVGYHLVRRNTAIIAPK